VFCTSILCRQKRCNVSAVTYTLCLSTVQPQVKCHAFVILDVMWTKWQLEEFACQRKTSSGRWLAVSIDRLSSQTCRRSALHLATRAMAPVTIETPLWVILSLNTASVSVRYWCCVVVSQCLCTENTQWPVTDFVIAVHDTGKHTITFMLSFERKHIVRRIISTSAVCLSAFCNIYFKDDIGTNYSTQKIKKCSYNQFG
jgi:hypothetical protein